MPIGLHRHFVDRTPLLALAFLAAGLTLAAGDDKGGSSSGPIVPPWSSEPACPPPPPTTWEFQCSRGMPATPAAAPGGLWYFNFPVGPEQRGANSVHYVVRPGMPLAGVLTATWRVQTSGGAKFQYRLQANNTCGGNAFVTLYFQRRGDTWNGVGDYQYYRWFSDRAVDLADGEATLAVPLDDGAKWISVFGLKGNTAPGQFAAAVADPMAVGLTFGGGCFKGHGVNISDGSATFSLMRFEAVASGSASAPPPAEPASPAGNKP